MFIGLFFVNFPLLARDERVYMEQSTYGIACICGAVAPYEHKLSCGTKEAKTYFALAELRSRLYSKRYDCMMNCREELIADVNQIINNL